MLGPFPDPGRASSSSRSGSGGPAPRGGDRPPAAADLAAEQQDAVEELLTKAKVSVDPRYGRWDRCTRARSIAPTGPTPATTDSAPGAS